MSRRKVKRKVFHEGDPCDRRKPCPGGYHLKAEIKGSTTAIQTWVCNSCGKKRSQLVRKKRGGEDD